MFTLNRYEKVGESRFCRKVDAEREKALLKEWFPEARFVIVEGSDEQMEETCKEVKRKKHLQWMGVEVIGVILIGISIVGVLHLLFGH